jgi:hypothetical protein
VLPPDPPTQPARGPRQADSPPSPKRGEPLSVLRLTLLTLVGMVSVMSCGSDAGDLAPGPVCNTVIVHGENDETLTIGGQLQLGFLYEPCDINDHAARETKWSSGDATVATVTSNGLVTGQAVGTATITASVAGGSAGLEIHVAALRESEQN